MKELFIVIVVVVIALGFQLVNALTTPVWIGLAVLGHFVIGALTYRVVTYFDGPGREDDNVLFAFFTFFGYVAFILSVIVGIVYIIIKTIGAFIRFLKAVGGLK